MIPEKIGGVIDLVNLVPDTVDIKSKDLDPADLEFDVLIRTLQDEDEGFEYVKEKYNVKWANIVANRKL